MFLIHWLWCRLLHCLFGWVPNPDCSPLSKAQSLSTTKRRNQPTNQLKSTSLRTVRTHKHTCVLVFGCLSPREDPRLVVTRSELRNSQILVHPSTLPWNVWQRLVSCITLFHRLFHFIVLAWRRWSTTMECSFYLERDACSKCRPTKGLT